MEYNQKKLKRDAGGIIVPQFWNPITKEYEILEGSNGAYHMLATTTSIVAKEPFSGTGNMTKEFATMMSGFVISNDGDASLTFTIGDDTYMVMAGEVLEEEFAPFTTVIITSTVAYRAWGKAPIAGAVIAPPVDITAPNNVTGLAATNVTTNSLTLTWSASASSDTVGYDVYRGSTLLTTVTGLTYAVTGLSESTQYTFTVKAKDAENNIASGTSVTLTTATTPDTTAPDNVTNLATSNLTQNSLTLSWTASASSDIASYEVYNGTTLLATITGTTHNVTGLSPSTAYTFRVKSKDASGNISIGTSVGVTTSVQPSDVTPPNNVTNLVAGSVAATTLTLTWTASSSTDIASYDVFNGSTFLANTTSTTLNVTGLLEKTGHTFTVKAKDTSNNVASGTSVTVTTADITAPANVTNLTTASVTQTTLTLNWTASVSSDVASYDVYNGATLLGNVTAITYNVTGLTAGTAYTLWVKAKDASGNVASGTSVAVTTSAASDITAPNEVTSPIASPSSTTVGLSWTASTSTDIAGYNVYVGATKKNTSLITGTSYTVTGLTVSTAYTFTIKAMDTSGNESVGTNVSTTTTALAPLAEGPSFMKLAGSTTSPVANEYVKAPSVAFNEIIIVANIPALNLVGVANTGYLFDGRTGGGTTFLLGNTAGAQVSQTYINGVLDADKTTHFASIPKDTKATLRYVLSTTITDDVNIFSDQAGTNALRVNVYSIKLLNGGTTVVHYDFTNGFSGTVIPDSSGNGKVGTIYGGLWSSVATTTPPVITASVAEGTYASSQSVMLTSDVTADVYYTTDGSVPNFNSPVYSGAISIAQTCTLMYFATTATGKMSAVEKRYYTIITQGLHYSQFVAGYIQLSSMLFDECIVEMSAPSTKTAGGTNTTGYIFDARSGSGNTYVLGDSISNNLDVRVNGTTTNSANLATALFTGAKSTIKVAVNKSITDDVTLFAKFDTLTQNTESKVYSVKMYRNYVLKAHFDFTNQTSGTTVTDLTGNGNTCTITNGTWI